MLGDKARQPLGQRPGRPAELAGRLVRAGPGGDAVAGPPQLREVGREPQSGPGDAAERGQQPQQTAGHGARRRSLAQLGQLAEQLPHPHRLACQHVGLTGHTLVQGPHHSLGDVVAVHGDDAVVGVGQRGAVALRAAAKQRAECAGVARAVDEARLHEGDRQTPGGQVLGAPVRDGLGLLVHRPPRHRRVTGPGLVDHASPGVAEHLDRRDVHRLVHPTGQGSAQHPLGAADVGVDQLVALAVRSPDHGPLGAVHQPAGTAQGRDQRCLVGQVPGHELAAQRAQGVRAVRVLHQSAHAVPALDQQPRHLAAEEAGATGQEDAHRRTLVLCACPSRDLGVTGR